MAGPLILLLVSLAITVVSSLWAGYILTIMWGWFIIPTFHSLPPLPVSVGAGAALMIAMVTHQHPKQDLDMDVIVDLWIKAFLMPPLMLAAGWGVKLFT